MKNWRQDRWQIVFVSPNSSAGDPFNKRDEKKAIEIMSQIIADGDTQGKERICHFCWLQIHIDLLTRHAAIYIWQREENSTCCYWLCRTDYQLWRLEKLFEVNVNLKLVKKLLLTNCKNSTYSSIKEVVIDHILSKNKVRMYTSGELLNDEKKLKEFECRKNCLQRSK